MVFSFCAYPQVLLLVRLAYRKSKKRNEARLATGIPRMAEPFAGALPDLLIQRASRRSTQRVFPDTARKGECEGGTFDGFPHSRSVKDRACAVQFLQSKNCKPRSTRKKSPPRRVVIFGAGDEARTRYLDLGKVALYQMSYARRRHRYCSACGASGRGRTGDTRIFSPLLYQLSYRGKWRPRRGSNPRPPA